MAENKPEEAIEVEVKLKGVAKIKKDLKDIKNDLADATDPADIERLSIAAGALGDKLKDINEKIAIFADGSDFEKINNGLGLVQYDDSSGYPYDVTEIVVDGTLVVIR